MSLTMTRTRTQTALTRLARKLAEVHDELAFAQALHGETEDGSSRDALAARIVELDGQRDALYATLIQFDPAINPCEVGRSEGWRKPYGRLRKPERMKQRYLHALHVATH